MKKHIAILKSLLLFIVIIGVSSCSQAQKETRHVVILSMDGFRWDYTDYAQTPTLDSLRRVGSYAQIMPVFPSITFPNHYSMATGLHPNHHGITNNNFYDRELGRVRSVFTPEDATSDGFWGGEPIWNTVELQGGIAHIYMWPGSEYVINDRQATVWTPYDHHMDYFVKADKVVESMSLPEESVPDLVMWYMPDPDEVGHNYGPESEECIARVEYIDSVLSYFFAQMRDTPHFDNIDFIVTSDHGMTALSSDRYVNLYSQLDQSKVKAVVGGAPLLIEVDEDYIDQAVEILNSQEHLTAYRREAMPEEFHYGSHPNRITNIVAIPDMGWRYDCSATSNDIPYLGAHGFNPFEEDMQMVFYGAGPDFKRGYEQPTFQNLNMYLIICHLLNIEPAANDCDWDSVKSMFVK